MSGISIRSPPLKTERSTLHSTDDLPEQSWYALSTYLSPCRGWRWQCWAPGLHPGRAGTTYTRSAQAEGWTPALCLPQLLSCSPMESAQKQIIETISSSWEDFYHSLIIFLYFGSITGGYSFHKPARYTYQCRLEQTRLYPKCICAWNCPAPHAGPWTWPCWTIWGLHRPTSQPVKVPLDGIPSRWKKWALTPQAA